MLIFQTKELFRLEKTIFQTKELFRLEKTFVSCW